MPELRRIFVMLAVIATLIAIAPPRARPAPDPNAADDEICDPLADYFLGMEDYPEAIRRHVQVIKEHPGNALAHYHLGFAYGLTGRHREELREYRSAIDLGLDDWELFLNLGLLYLERDDLEAATDVLRLATLLGPGKPEAHYNLGLTYERRGMLKPAEQEILLALRLDPDQTDARNTLGVIYAEGGNFERAREEWTELAGEQPGYEPARDNLAILDKMQRGAPASGARGAGFTEVH